MAVRLALLADHYRADRQWTDDAAQGGRDAGSTAGGRLPRPRPDPPVRRPLAGVRARLADDLDTPGALAVVDDWADATLAGSGVDQDAPGLVAACVDALLGIWISG